MAVPMVRKPLVLAPITGCLILLALVGAAVFAQSRMMVTLVPGNPDRVTILSYRGPATAGVRPHHAAQYKPTKRRTITNPNIVQTLTRLANSVHPIPRHSDTACPGSIGPERVDILRFRYRDGRVWPVYLDFEGCAGAWSAMGSGWAIGGTVDGGDIWDYDEHLLP